MLDRATVQKVAHLARLELTADEEILFTEQLGQILTHINQLSELDTKDVVPTTRALETSNITRPDVPRPRSEVLQEALLNQAPQREESFFRVPRIG